MKDRLRDYGADVEQSGQAFNLGDLRVCLSFGYSEGGDWLRFLVVQAWPTAWTVEERHADPRYDPNVAGLPKVRHPDGSMRSVKTDGRVYLFVGDELRTMRVEMNEDADTNGLTLAASLDEMWDHLQRFRVAE